MHDFLKTTKWRDATPRPIAGDASARQYFRLDDPPAILMDDPSLTTRQFAKIAAVLSDANLCAPQVFAHNPTSGQMIIEDLGPVDFAQHLQRHPNDAALLYAVATDVLIAVSKIKPPLGLHEITHPVAAEMVGLASEHYAPDAGGLDEIATSLRASFDAYVAPELSLALRDYHAENLIWRPERKGLHRAGLLDFQDACLAPIGYDLMSLIRDARRDVDDGIAAQITQQFCTAIGHKPHEVDAQFACLGAQRNLRILGIFARLAKQDGKYHYVDLIPRVWTCLMRDLDHPALADLRKSVLRHLPAPDTTTLQRLTAK